MMNKIEQGKQLRAEVFGDELSEASSQFLQSIYPPMLNFLDSTFGEVYGENVLDLKTKEIIVLASLVTQKDTKPQLKVHIHASLRAGITPKEILALIYHLVIYVGFPATLNALSTAKEVFDEMKVSYL